MKFKKKNLNTKSDQNTHQNAPNCNIKIKIRLATCKFLHLKKIILDPTPSPPPSQIQATPL